ncbi:DUF1311 domain-containing protein [Starkeya koreensis]|uniref:DUF1311 domain-containing protein n=1 Tax=Ancylobacter koreensis TaxID=266121 RepID=A0ABT0DLQ0_9HYPH|nr:lysozyme inhibitor LprI family protein [Ancylobacter koreensis]MCK0208195.1 DUF1311 domain-containing protein [Ancylobacter koreensis]
MARLAGIVSLAILLLAAPSARAQEVSAACDRGDTDLRGFLDCLNRRLKASEAALERAVDGTQHAIDSREDLQPAQRKRWRALFEEAQGRFAQWRNFECQSIAPFEGGGAQHTIGGRLGGAGVMEGRMTCLIQHNEARAEDLAARYAPPGGWHTPASPAPEAASDGGAKPATGADHAPQATDEAVPALPTGSVRIIAP